MYINRNLWFIILLILIIGCDSAPVKTITRNIRSAEDIRPIDSNLVKPYDYVNVISLAELPVDQKKQKFIDLILPAILVTKARHESDLQRIKTLAGLDKNELRNRDLKFLEEKMQYFDADNIPQLINRLHTHPTSIVLAQAALESGWGTSRFFLEANNIFGVHSFDEAHDRVKAGRKRDGRHSYVKKYESLSESVEDYFRTLARGPYKEFRKHRMETDDPYVLIHYLEKYSITGEAYIFLLQSVIRTNNLIHYDSYRLDPGYIR